MCGQTRTFWVRPAALIFSSVSLIGCDATAGADAASGSFLPLRVAWN